MGIFQVTKGGGGGVVFGAERGAAGSAEPKLITKPTSEKKKKAF